jgi:molybdopterin biosynthesis enzyme
VRAEVLRRQDMDALTGVVLVADIRDSLGRVILGRGTLVGEDERLVLEGLPWETLHVLRPDADDVLEVEAGDRLALLEVNRDGELAIYTVADGQVVDRDEVVARVKIIPFVVEGRTLDRGVKAAADAQGVVSVRPFQPASVGVVVMESLGSSALERFRRALDEKAAWFGSSVLPHCAATRSTRSVLAALEGLLALDADLVLVAGTQAMDPLDPAFEAVRRLGGQIERVGVPAHPGSLLWLARINGTPVLGMPSCGLFSRATVFDLVLPRLLAGLTVDSTWLAGLGAGGLLTRDVAARFPPYRPRQERGAVD